MSHPNHLLTTFITFSEVSRVLTHYQEYYERKYRIADEDVFLVISPPWLNTLELSLLWIGGYKPSQVLRLATDSVLDLNADQLKSSMETLFQEDNGLREMTVSYILEKLESAHQKLKFFAAAIQLHLRVGAVRNQRDAERRASRA
ncbi:hypothetical protein POM88_048352 [Heracleum sosnowskyi]|uniref:DOG1 domain-containing protein n=1 Tax=Heracleum sosnowskyi TaxID=360622 RepID=A0AAD8LZJ9_9APIA|nr:hypothetical protein POM88_048352 [Heracleum sosnowskyi]